MSLILQLGNASNWESVYFSTQFAYQINTVPPRYAPIPKIVVPTQLESHILAVYVSCTPLKSSWHFAGWLSQKIFTGLTVGGTTDAESVQRRKIWLNKITLIRLEKLANSYSIAIEVPKWFQSVSIQVWEYIGPVSDSTEVLIEGLKTDIVRLESKIDAIN